MALKHNKKKNGRIVYEQLMILATRLARSKHIKESSYILDLIKEHYAPQTALGREKKLFDSLFSTKVDQKTDADAILVETLFETRLINQAQLEKEKVSLINRVLRDVGKDLFSIPVREYKLLASAQILFNETRNDFKHSNPSDRVKIKNLLTENMGNIPEQEEDYEMDNFTFNILVKKFDEKYSSLMNQDQKEILSEWVHYLLDENDKKFSVFLNKKVLKAKGEIDNALVKKTHLESDYLTMLKEARVELGSKRDLGEESIHKVMKYYDLIEDLRELENAEKTK